MNLQHKQLASGQWQRLPFIEQMANIDSEIERSLNWRTKNNAAYSERAFERALELIDLTLEDPKNVARLKELTRVREALVDFFIGENSFSSTEILWRKYFSNFTYAARRSY